MSILALLSRLWTFFSASGIVWKVARNYRVLSESVKAIEEVVNDVATKDKKLPSQEQSILLAQAFSNILKTGIIDIPGVDEHELAVNLDALQANFSISIKDAQSGQFYSLSTTKKDLKL